MTKQQEEKWYVFYTKSRAEKKTLQQVERFEREAYLPLVKEVRQWSDRKKTVETPLFKSYIFVHCAEYQIPELLQWIPGLVACVRHNGKPAYIRPEEIEQIQRFVDTGLRIETKSSEGLKHGDKVKVMGGPLEGMEGEVLHVNNHEYFIVRIEAIQQYLKIQIQGNYLEKIRANEQQESK